MFGLTPYRKNAQLSYNPFHEMEDLERRFFDEPFFGRFFNNNIAEFKTDISEQEDSYLLEADMPGFKKEDIHLDLNNDTLTINAQRHSQHEDKDGNYLRCERSYGQYSRSFDMSSIDTDNIKARLEDGVLKLTLPKKHEEVMKGKRLEIE